jgi:hypothetical protein
MPDKKSVEKFDPYATMLHIENMKASAPQLVEMQSELAKVRKKIFDAHVAQGFTEAQALTILIEVL